MCHLCDKIYTMFESSPNDTDHYSQDPEDATIHFVTYYYDVTYDHLSPVSVPAKYCHTCGSLLKTQLLHQEEKEYLERIDKRLTTLNRED